jgi:hypothetical protein
MLANHPIDPMILATDLAVARGGDRIGLEVVLEIDDFVTLPSQRGPAPPPPYKMALLTWVTSFPPR